MITEKIESAIGSKVGIHFSSQRMDWKTPKAVYQMLDAEFRFDHDPCPPNWTVDGLTTEWGGGKLCEPSIRA